MSAQAGIQMTNIADRVIGLAGRMRDLLVGLAIMVFVALFGTYLYAPDVFHHWINRLFFTP
jgi:hypothetical protein